MVIHQCIQGSPEWLAIRNRNFTCSELGAFALEPVKINLTVDEIKAELDAKGVFRKGLTKRDDLLDVLPGKAAYAKLSAGARTFIIKSIKQERLQSILDRIEAAAKAGVAVEMNREEEILFNREEELIDKENRQFGFNIPVKYGKLLEPFAREFYRQKTGHDIHEVGFIEHDSGGFGCSPDGLVMIDMGQGGRGPSPIHGIEIKCPIPETHLGWLMDGTLPDEHKLQVHGCMAVTGMDRWDFLSYSPGDAPLLIEVYRDDFTNKLEAGLKTLVAEKAKMKRELAAKFEAAYRPLVSARKEDA